MSDKDEQDKTHSSDNVDSHIDAEGSTRSLVAVVDVIKQKALACYRSAIPDMPEEGPGAVRKDSQNTENMPAETQGLAERVAETLNKTQEFSSGTPCLHVGP